MRVRGWTSLLRAVAPASSSSALSSAQALLCLGLLHSWPEPVREAEPRVGRGIDGRRRTACIKCSRPADFGSSEDGLWL